MHRPSPSLAISTQGPWILHINTAIERAGELGAWSRALSLLEELVAHPTLEASTGSYTIAMKACGDNGAADEAVELLRRMIERGLVPDTFTYCVAITARGRAGDCGMALELLESMEDAGVTPDDTTIAAVVSAFGTAGRWEAALQLVESHAQTVS